MEDVVAWRERYARLRLAASIALKRRAAGTLKKPDSGASARTWIATIETEGARLWERLPPNFTKRLKHQRGAIPSKKARVSRFLGLFETCQEARLAYDAAKLGRAAFFFSHF